MAIAWDPSQATRVSDILSRYPVDSGQCALAAREIHPVARERDPGAGAWQLWPGEGRYVVPKVPLRRPWYYHVTVEAEGHCVDALTGVPGTSRADYVKTHWRYDAMRWEPDDLSGEAP